MKNIDLFYDDIKIEDIKNIIAKNYHDKLNYKGINIKEEIVKFLKTDGMKYVKTMNSLRGIINESYMNKNTINDEIIENFLSLIFDLKKMKICYIGYAPDSKSFILGVDGDKNVGDKYNIDRVLSVIPEVLEGHFRPRISNWNVPFSASKLMEIERNKDSGLLLYQSNKENFFPTMENFCNKYGVIMLEKYAGYNQKKRVIAKK